MPDSRTTKTVGIGVDRKQIEKLERPKVMFYYVNKVFQEMYDVAVKNGFGGTFNEIITRYPIAEHFLTESLERVAKSAEKWVNQDAN